MCWRASIGLSRGIDVNQTFDRKKLFLAWRRGVWYRSVRKALWSCFVSISSFQLIHMALMNGPRKTSVSYKICTILTLYTTPS